VFLYLRNGAAGSQAIDFSRAESELAENLLVVLSDFLGTPCGYFGNAMHLNRAGDRRGQLAAGAFDGNDDVVCSQLRVVR
jgi:hypothetical protein